MRSSHADEFKKTITKEKVMENLNTQVNSETNFIIVDAKNIPKKFTSKKSLQELRTKLLKDRRLGQGWYDLYVFYCISEYGEKIYMDIGNGEIKVFDIK